MIWKKLLLTTTLALMMLTAVSAAHMQGYGVHETSDAIEPYLQSDGVDLTFDGDDMMTIETSSGLQTVQITNNAQADQETPVSDTYNGLVLLGSFEPGTAAITIDYPDVPQRSNTNRILVINGLDL